MRAYKFRIYPTLAQRRQLETEFQACRYVWNWALGTRKRAYQDRGESLNAIALSRMLTEHKTEKPFLQAASATCSSYVLKALDEAYQKFFKRQAKFPKFKKRHQANSCTYQIDKRKGASIFASGQVLKLPKLGAVRVRWSQEVPVMPENATVTRTPGGQYFVSLCCNHAPEKLPELAVPPIGLDLGIKDLVADSRGDKVKPPRYARVMKRRLAHAQRALSRAQKGAANRRKQKCRVARLHQRIGDQRRDFLHKLSTSIARENQAIGIEDLHVRGVMANGKLASAVADCGWGELRRQLEYKSAWYGRDLRVVPRFVRTTGVCPDCGAVGDKLPLSVRVWVCKACGVEHDRDTAAAQMIVRRAFPEYRWEAGSICLPMGTDTQSTKPIGFVAEGLR
jgi:putative transposase